MDIRIYHQDKDFRAAVPAHNDKMVRHVVVDVAGNTPTELERNAVDRAVAIAEGAGTGFVFVTYLGEGIIGDTAEVTARSGDGIYVKQVTGYNARVLIKYVSKVGA